MKQLVMEKQFREQIIPGDLEVVLGGGIEIEKASLYKHNIYDDGLEVIGGWWELIFFIKIKASINVLVELEISRTIRHRLTDTQVEEFLKHELIAYADSKEE